MVVSGGKSLKRMKRRVTADHHDFYSFPSPSVSVSENFSGGPFRSNVRSFLTKYALLPPPSALFPHLLTWQILFRVGEITDGSDSGPAVVCLDVVEEDVARSRSVYCDQCRVFGELTRQLLTGSVLRESLWFHRFFFTGFYPVAGFISQTNSFFFFIQQNHLLFAIIG
jgi:hypothetical protein